MTPAPVLSLQALGAALLRGPDGRAVAGLGAKGLGLIAVLAVAPGRAATRDVLVDLLWGDSAPEQGRASLRQELRRMKKALGPLFDAALDLPGGQIALRPGALASDVARLETACAARDTAGLAPLADLWGGPFLAPLAVAETRFQDWQAERNSHYEALALDGLLRLMLLDEAAGRLERAAAAARALLAIDPLQEDVHAALIRLHLAAGRLPQARKQAENARALFRAELGDEPETDFAALLPRARPPAAGPAPGPVRPAAAPDRPLVAVLAGTAAPGAEALLTALRAAALDQIGPLSGLRTLDAAAMGARAARAADWWVQIEAHQGGAEGPFAAASLGRRGDGACFAACTRDWPPTTETAPAAGLGPALAGALAAELLELETAAAPPLARAAPGWPRLAAARAALLTGAPGPVAEAHAALETRGAAFRTEDAPSAGPRSDAADDPATLALLAFAHLTEGRLGLVPAVREAFFRGRETALRALRRSPADPWALHLHGLGRALMQDAEGGRRAQLRALELAPGFAPAMGELARLLALAGDLPEAEAWSARALRLAPRAAGAETWAAAPALALFARGEAAAAADRLDRLGEGAAADPARTALHAAALTEAGRPGAAAARAALAARLTEAPGLPEALRLCHPFADPARTEALTAALG